MSDLEYCLQDRRTEFLADSVLEHFASVAISDAIFDDIVKNAGNDRIIVAVIARKNYGDVCGMREVGKLRSFSNLPIMVLCRKRERVIDRVGVSCRRHYAARLNHCTIRSSPA